jgi:hypothetical protein
MIKHFIVALALYILFIGTTHIPTPYFSTLERIAQELPGYDIVNSKNFDAVKDNIDVSVSYLYQIIVLILLWLSMAVCIFIAVQVVHQKLKHAVPFWRTFFKTALWTTFATIIGVILTILITAILGFLSKIPLSQTTILLISLVVGTISIALIYGVYALSCIQQPVKKVTDALSDLARITTYKKLLKPVLIATALTVIPSLIPLILQQIDITYIFVVCIPVSIGYLWHKL